MAINHMWRPWKVAFFLAHLKCQCQLQASEGGGPLGSTHAVTPAPATTSDQLGAALDNLALAAANDTTFSSSWRCQTWRSLLWSTCSPQPTRNLQRLSSKQNQPAPQRQCRELLSPCNPVVNQLYCIVQTILLVITHTVQGYFWHARLRPDARRVIGPDH